MHGRGVRLATPLPARRSRVQFFFFFGADSGRIGRNTPSQAVPAPKPTWLSAVRMAAEVFLEPNQASIFSFRFPVSSSVMRSKSKFKCLKFLTSLPRGPSTSITLVFTLIFDPIWDVHGLWWQDGLHGVSLSNSSCASLRMKNNEVVAAKNPKLYVCIYSRNKKKENLNPFGPLFVFLWPNFVEMVFIYGYWVRLNLGFFLNPILAIWVGSSKNQLISMNWAWFG